MSPKLSQQLAFKLNALHPLGIMRNANGRYGLAQLKFESCAHCRIEMDLLHFADQVSLRPGKVLTFRVVHMSPYRVAVRAMKLCIHIQKRLNVVIGCWNLCKILDGIARRRRIDDSRSAGRKLRNVGREHWHIEQLRSGFAVSISGDDEEQPAGNWLCVGGFRKIDVKFHGEISSFLAIGGFVFSAGITSIYGFRHHAPINGITPTTLPRSTCSWRNRSARVSSCAPAALTIPNCSSLGKRLRTVSATNCQISESAEQSTSISKVSWGVGRPTEAKIQANRNPMSPSRPLA